MSLPQITVVGTLKKTSLTYTTSGKALFKFTVESSEKNTKGEWDNLYLNGELWDKQAEFGHKYFADGSVAIVTGKLVTKMYEKQDGTKVYENKLLFPSLSFVPKDKSDNQSANPKPQQQQQYQEREIPQIDIDENEIPF